MSGPWHPTGRAVTSPTSPRAHAVCDRCGFVVNRIELKWQLQWQGTQLQNLRLLVCRECYDRPQPQLKTIILPADPLPILNPRPDFYAIEVPSFMATEDMTFFGGDSFEGNVITTEDGNPIIMEINDTPVPNPNNPVIYGDG